MSKDILATLQRYKEDIESCQKTHDNREELQLEAIVQILDVLIELVGKFNKC